MKDFFDSLGEHLKDRFSSPLAGAFIVSWLLWNYKVVFTLFSDMKPWVKFGFISDHVWTDPGVTAVHVLVGPGLTAIAYILLYPFPARWVWAYNARHKRTSELQRQKIEEETPLTKEEAELLKANLRKQIDAVHAENRQLNTTLAEYRVAQRNIDDTVRSHNEEKEVLQVELKAAQAALEGKEQELISSRAIIETLKTEARVVDTQFVAAEEKAVGYQRQLTALNEDFERIKLDRGRIFEVLNLALKERFPDEDFDADSVTRAKFLRAQEKERKLIKSKLMLHPLIPPKAD